MSSGAGQESAGADIVCPDADSFPVEGFVGERDTAAGQGRAARHDGSLRIALAAIDQISIRDQSLARIRRVIGGVTGLARPAGSWRQRLIRSLPRTSCPPTRSVSVT